MVQTMSRSVGALALIVLLTTAELSSQAETYPSGPVHLIVAYAAGGTGDVVARTIAPKLSAGLGQSVVVENRAGASGAIGARTVVAATPDGLTLLVGQTAEVAINQHWLKGLNYDPDKDLQPVALLAVVPLALVVPAKAPYSDMAGLVKALGQGEHTFASAGTGTPGHFAGEVLKLESKGNMTHVPYKGAAPALADLLGSHVDFYFPGTPAALPYVKAGQMKMLAVSTMRRTATAPDVPTVIEATGIKDFDFSLWGGFFAPHGTPDAVVATLNGAINDALALPDIRQRMADAGADIIPMSVAQFAAFMQAESAKYARIIRNTGIKPE